MFLISAHHVAPHQTSQPEPSHGDDLDHASPCHATPTASAQLGVGTP